MEPNEGSGGDQDEEGEVKVSEDPNNNISSDEYADEDTQTRKRRSQR